MRPIPAERDEHAGGPQDARSLRLGRLNSLHQAGRMVLEERDPECIARQVARISLELLDADDVSLMCSGEDGRLRILFALGLGEEVLAETNLELGERVAGRVAAERVPLLIQGGIEEDSRFQGISGHGRVGSAIVYPLTSGEELLGVLNLSRASGNQPFRSQDVEAVGILASQAALALRNSRLTRELAAAARLAGLGQLAAAVAHEINNPLAHVLLRLDSLQECLDGEDAGSKQALDEAWEHALQATQAVERIRHIVERIRDIRPREHPVSGPVSLGEAFRSALALASPEVRYRAVLRDRIPELPRVMAVEGQLVQVFLNLLVNAAHATGEGDAGAHRITVTGGQLDGTAWVEVEDSGCGIPPEDLERVFQPFYTTKPPEVGTGLGLAVSREILLAHGGRLEVESTVGEGSRFRVVLPVAAELPELPDLAGEATPSGVSPRSAAAPLGDDSVAGRGRVLVIEDEDELAAFLERSLGRRFRVTRVASGREAIAGPLVTESFDAVLCDLMMPDMSGMQVHAWATRELPALAPRFLFMTGGAFTEASRAFVEREASRVLVKPFRLRELHEALATVLR